MNARAWKFRRLPPALRSGRVLVGGGIVFAVAVIAIFAPWIAPPRLGINNQPVDFPYVRL